MCLSLVLGVILTAVVDNTGGTDMTDNQNVGTLTKKLFTFKDHACAGEHLHARCPHGTTIAIQFGQYGRSVPSTEMCPSLLNGNSEEDTDCRALKSLQIIIDLCNGQRQCKIHASSDTFGKDPCPGTSKYLEIAYKCRPNEFRTRVTCEGEEMLVKCQKAKRIAVYSAMFGRSEKGHTECPSMNQVKTECTSNDALSKVIGRCHGQKHCNIPSDEKVFGSPCSQGVPKFLRVVYTCVPKRILELDPSDDESQEVDSEDFEYGENHGEDGSPETKEDLGPKGEPSYLPEHSTFNYNDLTIPPPTTESGFKIKSCMNATNSSEPVKCVTIVPVRDEYIGFVADWVQTIHFLEGNKEKFILYVVVGVMTGLLLILVIIVFKLSCDRRRKNREAKKKKVPTATLR